MTTSLLVTWDGHTAGALAHRCAVPHVELLADTDSTMDVAHALAENEAPDGTLVVADAQRAGRGRLGRPWTSHAGRGVWCTIIERPNDAKAVDALSVRAGIRLAEALDTFAGSRVRVKWPNDLVIPTGKVGGILTEARWSGSALAWVAIGVGINVVPPPDAELSGAGGLREGVPRIEVLAAIVGGVRSAASSTGELSAEELERYAARDVLRGRRISLPATGTVVGIDATGALLVESKRGLERLRNGTVQYAEER